MPIEPFLALSTNSGFCFSFILRAFLHFLFVIMLPLFILRAFECTDTTFDLICVSLELNMSGKNCRRLQMMNVSHLCRKSVETVISRRKRSIAQCSLILFTLLQFTVFHCLFSAHLNRVDCLVKWLTSFRKISTADFRCPIIFNYAMQTIFTQIVDGSPLKWSHKTTDFPFVEFRQCDFNEIVYFGRLKSRFIITRFYPDLHFISFVYLHLTLMRNICKLTFKNNWQSGNSDPKRELSFCCSCLFVLCFF